MKKYNFKSSLFGYDPESVHEMIARLEDNLTKRLKQLREELADEMHQLQLVKTDVDRLKKDVDSYKSLEKELYSLLTGVHLDATKKVYSALQESEKNENNAANRALLIRAELENTYLISDRIKKEIVRAVNRYKLEIADLGRD